jgi:hypothetical protein
MSFTYAELKTAIQDFTENNEPSFVRNIPLFIRLAEERILKNVQLNLFRQNSTAQVIGKNEYLEVPSDFLAPFSLSYTTAPKYPTGASWNENNRSNLAEAIFQTSGGQTTPINFLELFETTQAYPGIALGSVGGNATVFASDSTKMNNYVLGITSSLTESEITYIEDYMLPYMAARPEIYSDFYDATKPDSDTEYIEFKDVSFLREYQGNEDTTGDPKYYAQFNEENFILSPKPRLSFRCQLSYFYRPISLTAGAESGTTWLSKNAEMAMFYGALIEAAIYMKEEPDIMQMYMARFQESLVGIKMLGEAKETTDEYRTGKVVRQKQ